MITEKEKAALRKRSQRSVHTVRCKLCGSKAGLQRHHPDYSKPDLVVVLCQSCHTKEEKEHDRWGRRRKARKCCICGVSFYHGHSKAKTCGRSCLSELCRRNANKRWQCDTTEETNQALESEPQVRRDMEERGLLEVSNELRPSDGNAEGLQEEDKPEEPLGGVLGGSMREEWREIEDFPGYDVSNLGRVRTWKVGKRTYPKHKRKRPALRVLCRTGGRRGKEFIEKFGSCYLQVELRKGDGKRHLALVHRLVAEAFVVNPDPKKNTDVNHKDSVRWNNISSNLEWTSRSANLKHGYSSGNMKRRNAKLSEDVVSDIRRRYETGRFTQKALASEYDVHQSLVCQVVKREIWKHVK